MELFCNRTVIIQKAASLGFYEYNYIYIVYFLHIQYIDTNKPVQYGDWEAVVEHVRIYSHLTVRAYGHEVFNVTHT